MDKIVRRSEEEPYLWIPIQFLDQTVIAIFKCLGLLCPTAKKTPVTLNQPEEEEDVAMKDDGVVLLTRGRMKARAKKKDKENTSKGRPGQTNKLLNAAIDTSALNKKQIEISGD
ncbi:PREDICTED: elicitor peptide 2-like [Camelina sativa]|uniref:Elicitor peptide 2-like n=1 Tax=Camelina sativa TaxID=90675 RepID=A0ABM0UQ86_CAMSA|nr:PREDICTED: elicitor peptide 2-like [Camelina sativa]